MTDDDTSPRRWATPVPLGLALQRPRAVAGDP